MWSIKPVSTFQMAEMKIKYEFDGAKAPVSQFRAMKLRELNIPYLTARNNISLLKMTHPENDLG